MIVLERLSLFLELGYFSLSKVLHEIMRTCRHFLPGYYVVGTYVQNRVTAEVRPA